MASLAMKMVNGLTPVRPGGTQDLVRLPRTGRYALRPLPNEDIALWVKAIDNSRVIHQGKPEMGAALWRYIGGAAAAAAIVLGLLVPGAWNWLDGYRLNGLETKRKALMEEREVLRLEQARIENPKQLETWAAEHGMKAPDSHRLVYLRPTQKDRVVAQKTGASANR